MKRLTTAIFLIYSATLSSDAWSQSSGAFAAAKSGGDSAASNATLAVDPALSSANRASGWATTIIIESGAQEAKIQANLCDIGAFRRVVPCGRSAFYALLAGPVDDEDEFAELADLDALRGSARVQLGTASDIVDTRWRPRFTANATVARRSFSFLERDDLSSSSVNRNAYDVRGGFYTKTAASSARLTYAYQHSFAAGRKQEVCSPAGFGPPGTVTCRESPVGEPRESVSRLVELDLRWIRQTTFGIQLSAVYDAEERVWGVQIPLTFVTQPTGGPAAGVRFGYRSDTDAITVAIIAGAFKL